MTGVNLGTLFAKLLLEDDFSATFDKYLKEQDKAQKKTQAVADGMKVAGLAAAAFGATAVNAATELNKSMANVSTLLSGNDESVNSRVKELKGSVQDMAQTFGTSTKDISGGLYELISTLGDSADNAKILEINVKAAQAGLATTADAISFTTAVTKTYGDTSAEAFQKVSDLGFQTVNLGKTTFPELAQAIGRVAPLAKETGVSLEEMFAIIASQTGVTGNTNEVITQMSSAIAGLVSPNKELMETYQRMGVTSGEALIKQRGLVGALQDVAKAAKDTDTPLINLVGRKEAWVIASSLAGAQAESFSKKLEAMGVVAGATDTAFRRQTEGIAASEFQWRQWKASAEVAAQKVGDAILNNLPGPLAVAAVGFGEMGGKALASAGELAQVAIAAKMLGGANILSNIGAAVTAVTGLTGAAAAARLGLIAVGVAIAAWSFAKIYEALDLINQLRIQSNNLGKEQAQQADKDREIIEMVSKKTDQWANSIEDAHRILAAFNRGLTGQTNIYTEAQAKQNAAFIRGQEEARNLGLESANLARSQKAAADETAKATGTFNPFAEKLKAVNEEVSKFSATQRTAIEAGTKLGRNAEEIANEWNKVPGAARMTTDAIQMYMNSAKEATKETKNTSNELQRLREQLLGLGAVKDALDLTKILGGNAGNLDPQKLEEAFNAVHTAVETVSRLGAKSAGVTSDQAESLRSLERELKKNVDANDDWVAGMKQSIAQIKKVDDRVSNFTGSMEDLQKKMKAVRDRMNDRDFGRGLSDEFNDLIRKNRDFVNELDDLQNAIDNEVNPALRAAMVEFRNLRALDMGQEIGDMVLKTDEFKDVLLALTPMIPGLATVVAALGDKSDGAAEQTKKLRHEISSLKDAFSGDIGKQFAQGLVNSILEGFKSNGIEGAISSSAKVLIGQVSKGIGGQVGAAIGSGIAGAFASAAVGAGVGIIFTMAYDTIAQYITRESTAQKQLADAIAARNQLINQMGISQKQFVDALNRANLAPRQITALMEASSPEKLETAWRAASEALAEYQNQLKGLATMASGAAMIGKSLGMSLDASKTEQMKSVTAMQEAMIDAMKKAGSTSEEIAAQQAKFTEDNKNRVFAATEDQIGQYNRLGTVVGGVIANMAGRTGDLIGSILANKDAIQQLIDAQNQFGLAGEKTSAATQQVIDLYKYITNNEAAVTSIQGVTQVLSGMGEAFLQNADLANALGDELNADLQSMINNGVAVKDAFALAAPALQDLWEVWKEGKVTLDDTTVAMLQQAEAQGVVGEKMKDTNKQILDVLTQIRDMFSRELPQAIPRTTAAVQAGAQAQQRAVNQAAQSMSTDADRVATNWSGAQQRMVADTDTAFNRIKGRITNDFPNGKLPIEVNWKVPDLKLPDPEPYQVPVEFQMPEGRTPWDEGGPYGPGGTPTTTPNPGSNPYQTAAGSAPGGAMEGGRGTQTIVVERDGQKDLQFTAENLPDYVRIRAGNTVLGV